VGPIYSEDKVESMSQRPGWILKEDVGRGWRRVVPSPQPVEIVGKNIINLLLDNDIIVIAAGGGGIPVYIEEKKGWFEGIDAVIDKDLASAVIARDIKALQLMILTAVERVAINYGKPNQELLDRLTISDAMKLMQEGHFPPGSMGPKIQAAINFLQTGGSQVIITSVEKSKDAVLGKAGTVITH
jgi:carbamate kinase